MHRVLLILVTLILLGNQVDLPAKETSLNNQPNLIVLGKVIGYERPEFYQPPYGTVTILYVKIEKIVEGQNQAKYIRVGYGYVRDSAMILQVGQVNPSLPAEMFDGHSLWRFVLSRQEDFDHAVEVSRKHNDWIEQEGTVEERAVTNPRNRPKCVATNGKEKEVFLLEKAGTLRGYLLKAQQYEKVR